MFIPSRLVLEFGFRRRGGLRYLYSFRCSPGTEVAISHDKAVISGLRKRQFTAEPHVPKYRQVLESLSKDILSGTYRPGQKFPSEAALVKQFRTSRITIGRALRELTARGLVRRIAGSGTYVRTAPRAGMGLLFGLLIPELGDTEIFEPICHGIANARRAAHHALLWGHSASGDSSSDSQALELCKQFIDRNVAGVFFAPLEVGAHVDQTNRAIVSRLEQAKIPIVLLDRCILPYPQRSLHDLAGIDNRRAAYLATAHLLSLGVRRIAFVAAAGGAPTVEARITGFREALLAQGMHLNHGAVHRPIALDDASLKPFLSAGRKDDALVCVNDRTAARVMQVLLALGRRIPQDVRIVGMDDVQYASLLPIPLTTVHQPCREIGDAAMSAMLDRIAQPDMLTRDILLECKLVVRDSCGAKGR